MHWHCCGGARSARLCSKAVLAQAGTQTVRCRCTCCCPTCPDCGCMLLDFCFLTPPHAAASLVHQEDARQRTGRGAADGEEERAVIDKPRLRTVRSARTSQAKG